VASRLFRDDQRNAPSAFRHRPARRYAATWPPLGALRKAIRMCVNRGSAQEPTASRAPSERNVEGENYARNATIHLRTVAAVALPRWSLGRSQSRRSASAAQAVAIDQ